VGITLAGLFDQVAALGGNRSMQPTAVFTAVTLDGTGISALSTAVRSHHQSLDLSNALFKRRPSLSRAAKTLKSSQPGTSGRKYSNFGVIQYALSCDQAARIRIRTELIAASGI